MHLQLACESLGIPIPRDPLHEHEHGNNLEHGRSGGAVVVDAPEAVWRPPPDALPEPETEDRAAKEVVWRPPPHAPLGLERRDNVQVEEAPLRRWESGEGISRSTASAVSAVSTATDARVYDHEVHRVVERTVTYVVGMGGIGRSERSRVARIEGLPGSGAAEQKAKEKALQAARIERRRWGGGIGSRLQGAGGAAVTTATARAGGRRGRSRISQRQA
jgi:hypothetical protein